MRARQYVAYYRVSTKQQGHSGLGLEAQREIVRQFVQDNAGKLVAEFSEIRSGLKSAGPELREALRICRMRRATIVVAMVDRLSRRVALVAAVMNSDIELAVADCPNASPIVLHIKAAFAQHESTRISERVKAALAEARRLGKKLGKIRPIEEMRAMSLIGRREWSAQAKARAMAIAPLMWKLRLEGKTLQAIATELNWQNIPSSQGRRWYSATVLATLRMTEDEFAAAAEAVAARPDHRATRATARAERIAPVLWQLRMSGNSLAKIAREMNRRGVTTTFGRAWCVATVRNALARGARGLPPADLAAAGIVNGRLMASPAWAREAAPIVWSLRKEGMPLQAIARELNRRKIATARGGRWDGTSVKTVLQLTRSAFAADAEAVIAAGHPLWPIDRGEHAAAVVPLMLRLRKHGRSYEQIADELNRTGVATLMRRRWYGSSVKHTLQAAERAVAAMAAAA